MKRKPDSLLNREDIIVGTLLGTALGDALGLPCEGMRPKVIERRFGRVDRFHMLGRTGFVSDDTEQSALVAQSLLKGDDVESSVKAFRRSLLGWFLRLPWGIGLGTLRSCIKIALALKKSGVFSAGNGAAMRSAVIGAHFSDDREKRIAYADALAQVTHSDPRAVEGARFVSELAAHCVTADASADRRALVQGSLDVVHEPSLAEGLTEAIRLAESQVSVREAGSKIGTSGFVLHSVAFAVFAFIRFGNDVLDALTETISVGGDTDTTGAIVGGWLGALHGAEALPGHLIGAIQDGPFGPTHLRRLGTALARGERAPSYSALYALVRNLALYPVVLAHGFRRIVPF
jgi:ADP-ribosyl-[dinitrogen reductase] hydrolase